jgi:hypothetical protein
MLERTRLFMITATNVAVLCYAAGLAWPWPSSSSSSSFVVEAWWGTRCDPPCVRGNERIMRQKEHGTSHGPVQANLRWNCDAEIADRICNFNRHYAERSDYWSDTATFLQQETGETLPVLFYDSNTGRLLFTVPVNRTWHDFMQESRTHGWPSFRDAEVHWDNVRVLPNGETVSTAGTHLGHNLPDELGNRYCINLVSIAGFPVVVAPSTKSIPKQRQR